MAKHRFHVQLRWADFDAMAHVNNTAYFEFMQDARVSLIQEMGHGRSSLQRISHFVARNEIDYIKPIEMDEQQITVELWISRFGGASYDVSYEILNQRGEICAKAKSVMVTVEVATGTVIRVPDEVREALAGFTG